MISRSSRVESALPSRDYTPTSARIERGMKRPFGCKMLSNPLFFRGNLNHLVKYTQSLDLSGEVGASSRHPENFMHLDSKHINSISHITGGGLIDNIPRVIPKKTRAVINRSLWKIPKIMELIQEVGNVDQSEMIRTFNCGIGMVLVVSESDKNKVLGRLKKLNQKACVIGEVERKPHVSSQVEIITG